LKNRELRSGSQGRAEPDEDDHFVGLDERDYDLLISGSIVDGLGAELRDLRGVGELSRDGAIG